MSTALPFVRILRWRSPPLTTEDCSARQPHAASLPRLRNWKWEADGAPIEAGGEKVGVHDGVYRKIHGPIPKC
eukprot:scaffold163525_cov28-Tisochrysis_lutea.AAC.2